MGGVWSCIADLNRSAFPMNPLAPKPMRADKASAFLLSVVLTLLTGCATSKKAQLEHVAKDWCLTLRASQIIPLYPLTEDIQPGDVFLVQVPIDRQQKTYEDKGFLPLDNHLARIDPDGYTNFYDHSFFGPNQAPKLPREWMRPTTEKVLPWQSAPHAAFPTYSFSVRRGGGLNLAVPVQGVPVGLSLLGSDAAYGSVSIRNASTLGVDTVSLYRQLRVWARARTNFLESFAPSGKETNYVRIVTRVYLTGQMDVELRDASSRSAGLDVGVAKPVNLLFPELASSKSNVIETVASNYTNGWGILSSLLEKATSATDKFAPGGSLRLMAASARTIALQETFDPPLTLGYLGFDCAILDKGELGPPIPTHARLDPKAKLQHARVQQFKTDQDQQIDSYHAIKADYDSATSERQGKIRQLARGLKLDADGEGAEWIQKLSFLVDGKDSKKTEQFAELRQRVEKLK